MILFDPLRKCEEEASFTLTTSSPTELKEYLSKNLKTNFRILYQPKSGLVISHWRHVGVMAYAAGDLTLCIDEMGFLCEGGNFKQDCTGGQPILYDIVHFGRHRNIRLICTAQLPKNIATNYRDLSDEFRIFQTVDKKQTDYLAHRVGKDVAALLPKLPRYAFVLWRDTGEVIVVRPKGVKNGKVR